MGTGLAVRGAAASVRLLCLLQLLSRAWSATSSASLLMAAAGILSCVDSHMCLLTRVGCMLPGALTVARIMSLAVTGLRVTIADMFDFAVWGPLARLS